MSVFTERFNALNAGNSKLKVESAVIDKRTAELLLVFIGKPETIDSLLDTDRKRVEQDAEKAAKTFFKVKVTFKKAYADEADIISRIFDFLNTRYPSVMVSTRAEDCKVEIDREKETIAVKIGLDEYMRGFAASIALEDKIREFLSAQLVEECIVELVPGGGSANFKLRETAPIYIKRDLIVVKDQKRVYGKTILSYPKPIKSVSDESDSAVLCGKIGRFDKRFSKTSGNPYYIFELADKTGSISAKIFPRLKGAYNNKFGELSGEADIADASKKAKRPDELSALDCLRDNEEVVASGKISRDAFTKDLVFIANDINRCTIDYSGLNETDDAELREAEEDYIKIKPLPYAEEVQQNFFAEALDAPRFLLGKDFVIFDCETTGLDRSSDKIIELAAVRLSNGIITHTFSSLINPGIKIDRAITELTGITDGDLKDAPKIDEVFHDFYKFTRGASLVAHNIEFDMGFVRRAASDCRFKIDNDTYDTMTIARKHHTVHNYKLGTLCEYFGISLTDAHRAINDALATAKLFIKLAEKL